ncbi:MAG: methyltransferase domain-containing protein [Burkholderiales bacterium]|nr:methyltransferase domain-containing protein [Burkholderiales bacterium]
MSPAIASSPGYVELFTLRGGPYDAAMRTWPLAREPEFAQAIARAALAPGMVVADVPAGGGYLQSFLPPGVRWIGFEPSRGFTSTAGGHGIPEGSPLVPLPWQAGEADAAISLAGIHHLADKAPLFQDLLRVVKPGGRLVVSDVAEGSAVAGFLDGYVGSHNSTGHEGDYLSADTVATLRHAGWHIASSELVPFHWVFASRDDMAAFCHRLFDLRTSTLADTRRAIESGLGVDELPGGRIGMRWELMTIACERPA